MTRTRRSLTLPDSLSAAARKLFDRFAIAAWGDGHDYAKRLTNMFAALQPRDTIEACWAKDLVDIELEMEQWKQIEAGLLEAQAREEDRGRDVMEQHLAKVSANLAVIKWAEERGLDHRSETPELKAQWATFYEERRAKGSQRPISENAPGDPNDLVESFLRHGAELDRVGRMIATLEARRRSVLREMEQYRASRRGRSGRTGIIDGSFTEPTAQR